MSEYVHRIPIGEVKGVAQDPDQSTGNAMSPMFDKPLTARNGISIASGVGYGKRVLSAGFNASFNQIGNIRTERQMNIARKGFNYGLLGLVSGGIALPAVALVADMSVKVIDGLVENQKINMDNERKVSERGGLTSLGTSYD